MEQRRSAGRPPGPSTTREDVLRVAGELFLARGYRQTTLREIARVAGVDVATVAHHGGRKHELFARSLALRVGPAALLQRALARPREHVPHAIAQAVSVVWGEDEMRRPVEVVLAAALTDAAVRSSVRTYLEAELLEPLAAFIGGRHGRARASAVLAAAAGVLVARFALGVGQDLAADEPMRTLEPLLRDLLLGPDARVRKRPPAAP